MTYRFSRWSAPLLCSLALAACGDSPGKVGTSIAPGHAPNALLHREPDVVVGTTERLVPDPESQWGSATVGAWQRLTSSVRTAEGEQPMVGAQRTRAGVLLVGGRPQDHQIAFWIHPNSRQDGIIEIEASLNGVALGSVQVGPAATRASVLAPAPAWQIGKNVLEFELKSEQDPAMSGPTFMVGPIDVEGARNVSYDLAAGDALLPHGCGIGYSVEIPGGARLSGAAQLESGAGGDLELEWTAFHPEDGSPVGGSRQSASIPVDPGEPAVIDLDLDPKEDLPLRVTLRWIGDEDSALRLTDLRVEQDRPVPSPSVLMIGIDTLSARSMSVYGYSRETTPFLEELAETSVVFDNCISNATWTLPSFLSVMSGLYPRSHQLPWGSWRGEGRDIQLWEKFTMAPNRWTLAEAFRGRGYRTAGFVDNTWLTEAFQFEQGFDDYDSSASRIPVSDRRGGIELVSKQALQWLDRKPSGFPAFLFLHAFDLHGPYTAKSKWVRKMAGSDWSPELPSTVPLGGIETAYDVVGQHITVTKDSRGRIDTIDPLELVNAYDGGIAEVDDKLRKLFKELESRGVLDNTIVVIFADHGETGAESRHLFGHGSIDESVLHVPLIIRLPGGQHGGRRIPQRVQLVDVYPTLLELTQTNTGPREYLHGQSLVPAIEGRELQEQPIFSDLGLLEERVLYAGSWKLVAFKGADGDLPPLLTWPGLDSNWVVETFPELADGVLTEEIYKAIVDRIGRAELKRLVHSQYASSYLFMSDLKASKFGELREPAPSEQDRIREMVRALGYEAQRAERSRELAEAPGALPELDDAARQALIAAGYLEDT